MGTSAQVFYLSPSAKDFTATGEVDIRALTAIVGTEDVTTITQHPAAAGTTAITLDPFSSRATVGDITANAGWAFNTLGAQGIESVAAAVKIIAAGTWTIGMTVQLPVAGTGTGTLGVSFTAYIYRVSSAGTRTLLFSIVSASGSQNALTSAAIALTATASQAEIVLAAGETLHVGYISTVVQVAGLAGAVVAANAAWRSGAATSPITLPAPGVRTRYPRSMADTLSSVSDTLGATTIKRRTLADTIAVSDTLSRISNYSRTMSDTVSIADTLNSQSTLRRTLTDNLSAGGGTVVNNYIRPMLVFDE